ncbi:MAG: hypothetical protein V3S28_07090 [Acidimicrobiia bacterium]
MTLEQKQARIHLGTTIGLLALAIAFMATAVRSTGVELEWFTQDDTAAGVLLLIWIVGLVIFGLAFGSLWLVGRQLDAHERVALGDEFQVLMSRRNAVSAFVVTFMVAVVVAVLPGSESLPGDAVAAAIVGVAAATLAFGQFTSVRA